MLRPLLTALLIACSLPLSITACDGAAPDQADTYDPAATGPLMRPGENCLRCHEPGFGDDAPTWSFGGTVYSFADEEDRINGGLEGAVLTVTDAEGTEVSVTSNERGNFHYPEGLVAPFLVKLEYDGMVTEPAYPMPAGSCNACHSHPSPVGGAPGRIYPRDDG